MDALKRKRTQFRREFTLAADALERALQSKEDPTDTFATFSDCADQLFSCESALRDLWCEACDFDEAEYEVDQDKAMKYRSRYSQLKSKVGKTIKNINSDLRFQNCDRKLSLPKLELPKFDGEVKNWLLFWGQFKKIDQDPNIDDTDKFQYLLQSMLTNSSARQLVESYPPCGENYVKALEALKSRFARDDVLIETYVRGLIALMYDKGQQCKNTQGLSTLYDSLQMHLQALETLGVTKDKYASILLPMVESALPESVLRTWNRFRSCAQNGCSLNDLVEFLKKEVESEERIHLARQGLGSTSRSEVKEPTCCYVAETKTNKMLTFSCVWCDKDSHCSIECHKASKMTLSERTEHIKKKRACLICLKQNHIAKRCKSYPKCLFCKSRHCTLMCPNISDKDENSKIVSKESQVRSQNMLCKVQSTTLLQTLIVQICYNDRCVLSRALIDTGAQRSYIQRDLVEQLDMKPIRTECMTHCLFGGKEEKKEIRQVYDICVKSVNSDFSCQMTVVEQTKICGYLPKVRSSIIIDQLRQNNIILTDTTDSPDNVTLLIGADICGLLMTGDVLQVRNGLTAIKTKMGWTIQGPVTGVYSSTLSSHTTLHCLTKIDLSDLWSLESIGIRDPVEQNSKFQEAAKMLEEFERTIKIDEEGRYEVCLPWRDVHRPQSNYEVAKKRLHSTTHRLLQLGKLKQYDEVFKQWLDLGIIEIAQDQNIKGHYMPHHAVIKESSLTTKIRPVFDASAKDKYGISLNTCLEKGVNLLEQIPELLLKFRKDAIGVTADIAKAFLQISVSNNDRDFLRFLWWSDISDKTKGILSYRHKRVVFGVASSPFHLIATINYHLKNCSPELIESATKLKTSFYVDNCVTSVKSIKALDKFINEAKTLMCNGKFDLRGWVSSPVTVCKSTKNISVLGMMWDIQTDSLCCNVDTLKVVCDKLTKRTLLSVMQRVFDPIGFTCPTTIIPKMIMQKTWSTKLTWDEELPLELATEFKLWLSQAHFINECNIRRRLTMLPLDKSQNTLHVFCDASKDAYAVCI